MGDESTRKKKKQTEQVALNAIGEEIHIFDGSNGKARIKKVSMFSRIPTGFQFCPDCHKPIVHKKNFWECDICNYSIADEEIKNGEGFPTEESTYENDYGEIYNDEMDIPEGCDACGGPYPDCKASCNMYD